MLALAMAHVERVMSAWSSSMLEEEHDDVNRHSFSFSCYSSKSSRPTTFLAKEDQDAFADLIEACECEGTSQRYLKRLVRIYVRRIEELVTSSSSSSSVPIAMESDALSNLIFRASLSRDNMPSENESCLLSFRLPEHGDDEDADDDNWLRLVRIRIYPYHNDVALRLWEAGACLAEYFLNDLLLHHQGSTKRTSPSPSSSLLHNRHVIELGAGVGLTGLAIAAKCRPATVYLSDFTDACRRNLQHNLNLNRDLLWEHGFDPNSISQGYLEWNAFAEGFRDDGQDDQVVTCEMATTRAAFVRADILIAADVIYDTSEVDSLVRVVRCFLLESPTSKQAIFALTKRNERSFDLFLNRVRLHGIHCTWLAGGKDCDAFPKVFESAFTQSRNDVRIARLAMSEFLPKGY